MSAQKAADTSKTPMAKGLAVVEQRNFATLKEKLNGNVAWQVLTITYVEKLEREAAGETAKKKAPAANVSILGEDVVHLVINESETLGRSGKKYYNWKKGFLHELLHFCEPSVFPLHKRVVDSFTLMRQLCDYGFGLNFCDSKSSDQTSNNGKLSTFQSLKHVYQQRGRLFRALQFRDGMIDWCEAGVFYTKTIVAGDNLSLIVVDRVRGEEKQVPMEILPKNWKFTNRDIQSKYNFKEAHVVIPGEGPFFLHELFPRVRRTLERKASEQAGACKPNARPAPSRLIRAMVNHVAKRGAKRSAECEATGDGKKARESDSKSDEGQIGEVDAASSGKKPFVGLGAGRHDTVAEATPPSPPQTGEIDEAVALAKAVAPAKAAGSACVKAKSAGKACSAAQCEDEDADNGVGQDEEGEESEGQ